MSESIETTTTHSREFKTYRPAGSIAGKNQPLSSSEVYHSEEFKALCKYLGIDWFALTKVVTITLDVDKDAVVTVDHQYLCPKQ